MDLTFSPSRQGGQALCLVIIILAVNHVMCYYQTRD